LLDIRRISFS